ncbi:MAG: hypothetical protein AVDCRST_MAG93-2998, partial [uncultured Chloroflexia bacterium]
AGDQQGPQAPQPQDQALLPSQQRLLGRQARRTHRLPRPLGHPPARRRKV